MTDRETMLAAYRSYPRLLGQELRSLFLDAGSPEYAVVHNEALRRIADVIGVAEPKQMGDVVIKLSDVLAVEILRLVNGGEEPQSISD